MLFFSNLNYKEEIIPAVAHKNYVIGRSQINKYIHYGFVIFEIVLITAIFLYLYIVRLSVEFNYITVSHFLNELPRLKEYSLFLLVFFITYLYTLYNYRLLQVRNHLYLSFFDEISKVFRAISYGIIASIGIAFLLKILIYSRLVVILFWVLCFIGSFLVRMLKKLLIIRLAEKGLLVRNVIIVGAGKIGSLINKEFQKKPSLGFNVIGFVDDYKKGMIIDHKQVLGATNDLQRIIRTYPVDELIITIPSSRGLVDKIIKEFRKYDIVIRIIPEMYNLVSKTIEVGSIDALPCITLVKTPMRGLKLILKRILEWFISLCLIILLLPLFLVIGLLIKLDSKGPIIYKQKRVGKNGKYFNMYKFRTMVVNAEKLLENLRSYNQVNGPAFKMKNDPRVTRVGKILRRLSLDELPQLFNVLKGEMALIGPRPPLPHEVEEYGDWEWRRLEVLPGITGLWQVSGRSDLSFEQWINLDIYYIENWSFLLDLKIFLKTIPAVIFGKGAY